MKTCSKLLLFYLSIFLIAGINLGTRPISNAERYINQYKEIAVREMHRSGIPASIKLAQGLFESASGQSPLAIKANNHFGIKCKSNWTGPTYFHYDDDYDTTGNLIASCFRSYSSAEESYIDHTEFLTNRERYRDLFKLDVTDYEAWAYGLKNCGYATDANYPEKLISAIKKYNLYLLDKEAGANKAVPKITATAEPIAVIFPEAEIKKSPQATSTRRKQAHSKKVTGKHHSF